MKKQFLILSLFAGIVMCTPTVHAQYKNTSGVKSEKKSNAPKENRWFTGGMLGGGWSSNSAYVEISPIIGYKVTPQFHAGSRITYIYSSYTNPFDGLKYQAHNYGGSLFSRYVFFDFLFAHAEYELLSIKHYYFSPAGERRFVNSLFLGGGLFQSMGGRGFATVSILYNVLEDEFSPYNNPLIRIGFGIGL